MNYDTAAERYLAVRKEIDDLERQHKAAKAAMTEGLADPRGYPSAELERLYTQWGNSGCGLLITGNVLVDRHHLERPGNVVIDREPDADMRAALARWATAAKVNGARIWMQISHAGRQTSAIVNPTPKAPSAIALALPGKQFGVPVAMTEADIQETIQRFAQAAHAAQTAGFDGVQIHAAHGYLLSAFICPLTNLRTDEYGGSLENRCRYPLEVFAAVRAAWPADRPMSVRISAHDWAPGGNTPDDAVVIARLFKAAGCDVVDVSSGQTTRAAKPVYGRMYQTPFADRVRNEAGILTMAVGAISEADHANSIIAAGRADLCAVARPHLADPAWTLHEAAKLQTRALQWPRQYESGRDQLYRETARLQILNNSDKP